MKLCNRRGIDVLYHRNTCNYFLNYKVSNKGRYYRMEC